MWRTERLRVTCGLLAATGLLMACGLESLASTPTPFGVTTWYVIGTTRVNIRACGSTQCAVIGGANPGDKLTVIDIENNWHKLQLGDNKIGYVAAWLTSRTQATAPTTSDTRYVTVEQANVRSCAGESCSRVGALTFKESFVVTGQSDDLNGNVWYSFKRGGQTVWIAGWLTSTERPAAQAPPAAAATRAPGVQLPPARPPAPAYGCDCSKTCPQMSSCQEAYFQLQQCGCRRRDGDGDGVPCEEICPGG